jgi:hypothetical protein
MFKRKSAKVIAYAIVGCLTNLQFAEAQQALSTSTIELEKPKMIRRARPSGYSLPIAGELKLATGYIYGDGTKKTSTGLSTTESKSTFAVGGSYGILRNLYTALELNVVQSVVKQQNNAVTTGNESTSTREGLANPKLTLGLQFPRNPLTFVLGAAASLGLEERRSELVAGGNLKGNVSTGHSITPFLLAHNNSQSFLFGGRLGYQIKDKRSEKIEGLTSVAASINGVQNATSTSKTIETTGGNSVIADLFMELPRFYGSQLKLAYSSSEKTKEFSSSSGQTTPSDGSDKLEVSASAAFGVFDNMALVPLVTYETQLSKSNGVDSSTMISGGLFLGMSF